MFAPGRTALFIFLCLFAGLLLLSACQPAADSTESVPQTGAGDAVGQATQPAPADPTATAGVPTNIPVETETPDGGDTPADTPPAEPTEVPAATEAGSPVPAGSVTEFPDPNMFTWQPVATGLRRPLDLIALGDGSGRMLLLEQPGVIRVLDPSGLLPEPFLDIVERVGSSGNEQGLLGIALHPNFLENRFFYLNYTDLNGDTVVARFTAGDDLLSADPGSEKILLRVPQPYRNHNGGEMVFGPDGYLYIGLGDGGSSGDPQNNGQSTEALLGSILRIDVDGGDPYGIPADNPFIYGGGAPEVWAYGLRNPWRFSFDRLTGGLYIADVGQNAWEEINYLPAGSPGGANFGWNYREGTHDYRGPAPAGLELVEPVFEYDHSQGCSVTGGYVYRGQALPELRGIYIFADFCSGKVWGLLGAEDGNWRAQEMYQTGMNVSSFGEDADGELYLIDQGSGGVYRLQRP